MSAHRRGVEKDRAETLNHVVCHFAIADNKMNFLS